MVRENKKTLYVKMGHLEQAVLWVSSCFDRVSHLQSTSAVNGSSQVSSSIRLSTARSDSSILAPSSDARSP